MAGRSAGLHGSEASSCRGSSAEEVDMYALFGYSPWTQA